MNRSDRILAAFAMVVFAFIVTRVCGCFEDTTRTSWENASRVERNLNGQPMAAPKEDSK